ncbi:ParB/RepB/Spo0J family partition protein [Priestia megaterium]
MSTKVDVQSELKLEETENKITDSVYREKMDHTVVMVPINKVAANPLNPRANEALRTEEMQEILDRRGWEEPVVGYEKGSRYILLSGHRRTYAARDFNKKKENQHKLITHIPVYVVDRPETEEEELDRIASLQSGRVNWSPLDWAKYVYKKWKSWGKPPIRSFAKNFESLSFSQVRQYITVLDYYPMHEIEDDLKKEDVSMGTLEALVDWIKQLNKVQPKIVKEFDEDLIRKQMLKKIKLKKVNRDILRNKEFIKQATFDQIGDFLSDPNLVLEDYMASLGISKRSTDFNGRLISLGNTKRLLAKEFVPKTESERLNGIAKLEEVMEQAKATLKRLKEQEGTLPDGEENEKENNKVNATTN